MKILLGGDICPTVDTAAKFDNGDIVSLFTDTLSLFGQCDFRFVNLECAITDSENKIRKFGPNLKAPRGTAETLRKLGIDLCGLSNNHIFDFGKEGFFDTKNALDAAGIATTGFGMNYDDSRKNFVLEKNDEKIAILTVCEHEYSYALEDRMGSRPFDPFDTLNDIRSAKKTADKVIVIYHGGKEHSPYPSPRIVKAFRGMADSGADIVLGQHSHCIVTYENYHGCHLLHGQGNFHFIREKVADCWHTSLVPIYDTVSGTLDLIPICAKKDRIWLAKGEEKENIINSFAKRNEELANGQWKKGWHDFCVGISGLYRSPIYGLNEDSDEHGVQFFSHFLDCEAHTDVWHELFPTYNQTNEK